MMMDIIIAVLATLGTIFILLAGVGIVRMPDLYLRISVTTKAATLGIGLILGGAAVYFKDTGVTSRVLAIIFFMLLTAPIGAHLIGRASYFIGLPLWGKTKYNDLKGKYDRDSHECSSRKPANEEETEEQSS